ncbi:MAG: hypothetical protein ABI577_05655 [bacterium]
MSDSAEASRLTGVNGLLPAGVTVGAEDVLAGAPDAAGRAGSLVALVAGPVCGAAGEEDVGVSPALVGWMGESPCAAGVESSTDS